MLIGELSKKTGFSRDTIRFYEKRGLIKINRKERRLNNYLEYPQEILKKLLMIKSIKSYGFTLKETAEFIELIEMDEASCSNVSDIISKKIKIIDNKIQELFLFKQKIIHEINKSNCVQLADTSCTIISSNFKN